VVIIPDYSLETVSVPRTHISPKGYHQNPQTIGENIRKKRVDLGLLQRQVADMIGVRKDSIYNWERGVQPGLRFMPKVIEFLGYVPFIQPTDTLGRLAYYKRINGLSYEGLSAQVGIHFEQLQAWLTGRTTPNKNSMYRIEDILAQLDSLPDFSREQL